MQGINLMLDDANIDVASLAATARMDERHLESWLRGMVRDVTLDSLALLYDAAADLAVQPTLEMSISAPQGDD